MRPSTLDRVDLSGVMGRLLAHARLTAVGCVEWTGAVNGAGYGILRVGGRSGWTERCHRAAYALWFGVVPARLSVLHRCDNRRCMNPDHLFLGTPADNTADMFRKGRWVQPRVRRGEQGSNAKITEEQARDAVARLCRGETRTSIAQRLGVTISAISRISRGQNWKHITAGIDIPQSSQGRRKPCPTKLSNSCAA